MRQLKRHKNTPMGLEVICFSGKACLKGFKFLVITQPIKIFRKTLYFTQSFHHTLEFIILRSVRSSYSDNTSQRMQTHFQNIHRTTQNRTKQNRTEQNRAEQNAHLTCGGYLRPEDNILISYSSVSHFIHHTNFLPVFATQGFSMI